MTGTRHRPVSQREVFPRPWPRPHPALVHHRRPVTRIQRNVRRKYRLNTPTRATPVRGPLIRRRSLVHWVSSKRDILPGGGLDISSGYYDLTVRRTRRVNLTT